MVAWTHLDLNQGPLACEASALTELSYASTGKCDYHAAANAPQVIEALRVVRIKARNGSAHRDDS